MAKILQIHNEYLHMGGEDVVVRNEYDLLRSKGHDVRQFTVRNSDVDTSSFPGRVRLVGNAVWSRRFEQELCKTLDEFNPDIAHVHNTFPLLSPAVFRVLSGHHCRVVATLHNYRLICASGTFIRQGELCTKCLTGSRLNGVLHACYRGSRVGSAAVVISTALHSIMGTFSRHVDCFVVNTRLSRDQFIQFGLPAKQIVVKQNFVPDPPVAMLNLERKRRIVFAGRFSQEKGLEDVLKAWSVVDSRGWELVIVGEGPLGDSLRGQYSEVASIKWLERLPREELLKVFATSKWLVFPSKCFEQSPLVPIEAMSVGTPVILRDLGALPDIVQPEGSGLVFGNTEENELGVMLGRAMSMADDEWNSLSLLAQAKAKDTYSAERSYELLRTIYQIGDK